MAAKFYICMLLVVLVSSAVHSARLRRPQDKEKTSNFLYEKRGPRESFFVEVEHDTFFCIKWKLGKIPQTGLRKKIVSPKPVTFEAFKAHALKSYLF